LKAAIISFRVSANSSEDSQINQKHDNVSTQEASLTRKEAGSHLLNHVAGCRTGREQQLPPALQPIFSGKIGSKA
jgi:hypothetical protein